MLLNKETNPNPNPIFQETHNMKTWQDFQNYNSKEKSMLDFLLFLEMILRT